MKLNENYSIIGFLLKDYKDYDENSLEVRQMIKKIILASLCYVVESDSGKESVFSEIFDIFEKNNMKNAEILCVSFFIIDYILNELLDIEKNNLPSSLDTGFLNNLDI